MNILVSGSSGFIGSCLVKKLLELGHNVEGINTKNCDVFNYEQVKKHVKDKDLVFHLASISDPIKAENNNELAYNIIYRGTENMVMACKSHNIKIIYTSTRFVYGEPGIFPTPENTQLLPLCWYGIYKQLGENLLTFEDYIIRLGNVYGPSPRSHSVVTKFIKMIKNGQTIPIYHNLNVQRDFIYVDDVVDALILGITNTGIYNVGSGVETTLQELLDKISTILGKTYRTIDMKKEIHPFKEDKLEVQRVFLDINKIKNIGWTPKISLEEGITRCING